MDFRLVMFREDGSRRDFPLEVGTTTFGRKDDCSIRIPLSTVSRHHASIELSATEAMLKDLGAANGTYLNNHRILESPLSPGDQIMIGPVIFTVQMDGKPSDEEMIRVRTKVAIGQGGAGVSGAVSASRHVYISDEDIDPIAALEELASSADQTAIHSDDDDD